MKTVMTVTLVGLLTLITTPATAAPKKVASLEGITQYRLENGLEVLLFPDPSREKVTVNLTVFVGSRHEGYGETGMAHLLEHMVFKGTPLHPAVPKALQERGAQFNGTTWVDRTNYFETLPASEENLEFALRLEADRMVNSYVKREDLLTEMTVVRNEFERGENSPVNILLQRMMAAAFEWHNYGKSTIGNRSDIERVPIENLQAFYKKHYQPDNALLVVAGKFNESKALELIQKTFGALPKPTRQLAKTYTEEPTQDGERSVTLRRVGDVGVVGVMYHIPSGSHADFPAVEVLGQILTTPPAGILYKSLVETGKAASVDSFAFAWREPGIFGVLAEVRKDKSVEDVKTILLDTLEHLADRGGVDQAEVDRAKQKILKARDLAADDTTKIAIELSEWAAQGDWRLYLLHRDRIEKVTKADVDQVAKKYLITSNRTLGVFVPTEKPVRSEVPPPPELAKLLERYQGRKSGAAGESFDPAPAAIEARVKRFKLPNGMKVALLPKKNRGEAVTVRVNLRYGDADSLRGYETAAEFLPELMMRGTKKLTRQQIQDLLDKNRAQMSANALLGLAGFGVDTKRPFLPTVIDLLSQVAREPSLPEKEFSVLRTQELSQLEQNRFEPQPLAITWIQRHLDPYAKEDVRYVPTIDERIERVKALDVPKVRQLNENYLGATYGELVVVGDFDPEEVTGLITKALGDWKSKEPYKRINRPYLPDIKGESVTIETPDKANAFYAAGMLLPLRDDDADYPAMVIGNFILGSGALSSRLGDRLRQKDGLSYGAGSTLLADPIDHRARLLLYAICNPKNMPRVKAGAAEEVAKLIKDGVTSDELERAKKGWLQQQRVQRTSDGTLAVLLANGLFLDRTLLFQANLEEKVAGLSVETVGSAIKKYIDPARLSVVGAGDFAKGTAGP